MPTNDQVVFGVVQARIRQDGGPLSRVWIKWPHQTEWGYEDYDPRTAASVAGMSDSRMARHE